MAPAPIAGAPGRWLGDCVGGQASGVGVLRSGTHEPYGFFLGRMTAGRPRIGLVMLPAGDYMVARDFDASGKVVDADGEHLREQDQAWAMAASGARAVSRRFSVAGNKASAGYYARLAHKLETGRPE